MDLQYGKSMELTDMDESLKFDYEPDMDNPDVVQAIWLGADEPEGELE